MSIPPLVCSTPPPPEQCEDDKDHEDFEISYNLSQEDDEDSTEYNYGSYSSYNIYPNKSENNEQNKWPSNLCNVSEPNLKVKNDADEIINNVNFISNNELHKENITTFEENVIEDLNLIIDKNDTHDLGTQEYDLDIDPDSDCSINDTKIQDEGGTNSPIHDKNTDNTIAPLTINLNESKILHDNNADIVSNGIESSTKESQEILLTHDSDGVTERSHNNGITFVDKPIVESDLCLDNQNDCNSTDENNKKDTNQSVVIDDFGDFEDFQLNSTEHSQPLPITNENPWVNNAETEKTPEFGDFTANFDFEVSKKDENIDPISCKVKEVENVKLHEEENDDFDDFEDYRSSDTTTTIVDKKEATLAPSITVWNLHSSENDPHIVDSINTMLTSIFTNTLPESEIELVGKLESFLSETWGHLVDIDVRQPYMVNWNNSLGQKTLLKALCIDSRNILFGPKWNYNMPKYAANLSVAPLQPKKQSVSNSSAIDTTERVTTKETGGWVDPFTPDGQEYTYAEALLLDLEHLMATLDQMAHKHSTLKISELLSHACHTENESGASESSKRPIDLDVLESETSTKLNKIYSSTIDVQPLRHISLPDTHIFTPTDSETPRSKTIHYDNGPALTMSQTVEDSNQNQTEKSHSQSREPVENEYWDFQDFKGTNTDISSTNIPNTQEVVSNITAKSNLSNTGMTYQTQILQPIKIEPLIPTLNWPNPGEVKETFDDFSDFISSTKWGSENENQLSNLDAQSSNINLNIPTHKPSEKEKIDDEFETFQSAPMSTLVKDLSVSSIDKSQNSVSENPTNRDTPVKLESNSFAASNNAFTENQCSYKPTKFGGTQDTAIPQSSSINQNINDMLQPSASTSGIHRNQQKSGQILQPLTLESYSQINWPNPGIDLQDLSRFNPINSLNSLKTDINSSGNSKSASPAHNVIITASNQTTDDEIWGDFVSSVPKPQEPSPVKNPTFVDDDEWTDFVSSPNIKPQNGLNTISFNVHTNLSMQKSSNQNKFGPRNNQIPLDIPTLNYITPKSNNRGIYSEKHFQNL